MTDLSHNRYARVVTTEKSVRVVDLFDEAQQYPVRDDPDYAESERVLYADGTVVLYSTDAGVARIQSVVAESASMLAALWIMLSEHKVVPYFPEAVVKEVQSIAAAPDIDDHSIADLTDLPFITIDNVDSRDLDQAMHISAGDSGFTLRYALADAAHFVCYGTALFDEALRRGASYYLPGFSIPMLPRVLSEDLVSLNQNVLRRALVFVIKFDECGTVQDTTVHQARIKSAAKLSYSGVEDYYRNRESSPLYNQPYTATLDALRELGVLRMSEARKRNVVEYNRRSVEIKLRDDKSTFEITNSDRLQVEKYNEQISLVCNAEGARLLEAAGLSSVVQAVYRVHEAPDEDRLKKFSRLLKGLIEHHQLPADIWVWRWRDGKYGKREYLADFLTRLKNNQVDAGLLAAIQRQALMLSPASKFSSEAGAHHSLRLAQYARFSSPMREIAGIYTHREYLQFLSHDVADLIKDDEELRVKVIDAANRSKELQKRLNKAVMKMAIDQLFAEQLTRSSDDRSVWHGTVMSLRPTRVYVQLKSPSVTVKVYLRELTKLSGVKYRLDASSAYISGNDGSVIAIGQSIQVQVQSYFEGRNKWVLVPVESHFSTDT